MSDAWIGKRRGWRSWAGLALGLACVLLPCSAAARRASLTEPPPLDVPLAVAAPPTPREPDPLPDEPPSDVVAPRFATPSTAVETPVAPPAAAEGAAPAPTPDPAATPTPDAADAKPPPSSPPPPPPSPPPTDLPPPEAGVAEPELAPALAGSRTPLPDPRRARPDTRSTLPRRYFPNVLIDFRGFRQFSRPGPDRLGAELLSYFDVVSGLGGALIVRNETQLTTGNFASLMLIPQLSPDLMILTSIGVGSGVAFMPLLRLDLGVRGLWPKAVARWFPPIGDVQLDASLTAITYTADRTQLAQSAGFLLWHQPFVLEVKESLWLTDPGTGTWKLSAGGSAVLMWGVNRSYYFVGRLSIGRDPQHILGVGFGDGLNAFSLTAAASIRYWLTRYYGVLAEAEFSGQTGNATRISGLGAVFIDF